MTQTQPPPPTANPGLAAFVLSIVLAPVGLVFGIVSLVKARRAEEPRPLFGFLAAIIGSVGTLGLTVVIVGIFVFSGVVGDSQRAAAMCHRAAADPTLNSDLLALVAPLNEISAFYMPGQAPSAEEKKVVSDQIEPLMIRISEVLYSDGHGYLNVFTSGYDIYEFLGDAVTYLETGDSSTGPLTDGAGGTLELMVARYSDDLARQCVGQ